MEVLRKFCTPRHSPLCCPPASTLDENLFKAVQTSIECFVSDSAADEIRAGHMLAGQTVTQQLVRDLPQMKVVIRDKPHATRRNVSRCWSADPLLHDVQSRFVFGPQSPVRLISGSEQFQGWFATNCHKLEEQLAAVLAHRAVEDLRFAPHRYDSSQKPLGRTVLFFHALLATLQQIVQVRQGEPESLAALGFLSWIDSEKALQLAMLADAGDENTCLTRMFDYEGFPTDALAFDIAGLRHRIAKLFVGETTSSDCSDLPACFQLGYTKHMMSILSVQFPVQLNGTVKVIGGGVPLDAQRRCASRISRQCKRGACSTSARARS